MSCWTNDFEHAVSFSRLEVQRSNRKEESYISITIASHQHVAEHPWFPTASSDLISRNIFGFWRVATAIEGVELNFGHSEETNMAR